MGKTISFSQMIKVHPLATAATAVAAAATCSYVTSRRETFTIWMKSLVMQGNGCTVYNENGKIVYRIDNYDSKCSNEVDLMDLQGRVLFTILRKNRWFFTRWVGDRCNDLNLNNTENLQFQVIKSLSNILKRDLSFQIGSDSIGHASCYRIKSLAGKSSAFKITDYNGKLAAEAKRKLSSSGVLLGEDVLTMEVEPNVDHCLIMALVTVYGLIHHRL